MDHYDVLGVSAQADLPTLRAAHRSRARFCHPDLGGNEREMMMINEAWRVLRDPRLRARYDAERAARARSRSAPSADTVLEFGRYEGVRLVDVARTEPDYLEWLVRTPAGRPLRADIEAALDASREASGRRGMTLSGRGR